MELAAKKLIIALDDLDFERALKVVQKTKLFASTYKVGLSLFCAHGPAIVKEIKSLGVDVFLDLKLHDIPMQVGKAVEKALAFETRFLTVHALGGQKMLREAATAALGSSTTLLAVSVLTSVDNEDFRELGFLGSIEEGVMNLSNLAFSSGIRGFVSSPHEVGRLKRRYGDLCLVVCPGVRPMDADVFDQSRIMTPKDAILAGADALVVGRPITASINIEQAALDINRQIKTAFDQMPRSPDSFGEASL